MLRIVSGRASSGKSDFTLNELKLLSDRGGKGLLIVPEQTTFSMEKKLLLCCEGAFKGSLEVRSFKRLSEDLIEIYGGGARKRLSDAMRLSLMRKAVISVDKNLKFFKTNLKDSGFYSSMAELIDEMKKSDISPERLSEISKDAESVILSEKMHDLFLIYDRYSHLLSEGYRDENDVISEAASRVSKEKYFAETEVFLDGFTGFTEPEYKLIELILKQAPSMTVTLLSSGERAYPVFSQVDETANRLKEMAHSHSIKVIEKRLPAYTDRAPAGLLALEKLLVEEEIPESTEGVRLIEAKDIYDEIESVASEILELVRIGYRFWDIAVIARDLTDYKTIIRRVFRIFSIPFFADWKENESYSQIAVFVKYIFALSMDFNSSNLIAVIKSGLFDLTDEEIFRFENYLYVWELDREGLCEEFTGNPEGFTERTDRQSEILLSQVEKTRKKVVETILPYIDRISKSRGNVAVREIYNLLKECGAFKRFYSIEDANNAVVALEELYDVLSDDEMPLSDMADLANTLFSKRFVGEIPETLDQVQVGSADRIRTVNPKAVFVIGMNKDVFPKEEFSDGLLNFSERDYLKGEGIDLPMSFVRQIEMESLYFYNALTTAKELVYLCFPLKNHKFSDLKKNDLLEKICSQCKMEEPLFTKSNYPKVYNKKSAERAYLSDDITGKKIKESKIFDFCDRFDAATKEPVFELNDDKLLEYLKENINEISPTAVENFGNCAFSYFLDNILKIKKIRKAEISGLEVGNYIHKMLDEIIRDYNLEFHNLTETEIVDIVESYSLNYENSVLKEARKSARMTYILSRLKAQTNELLNHLKGERVQSKFLPCDFEAKVSKDSEIKPKEMEVMGKKVSIIGKIDRVDCCEIGDNFYVRVIDYKTGNIGFDLGHVYYGLRLQMLLYLFSLTSQSEGRYSGCEPAGVLYVPSDPNVSEEDVKKPSDKYKMEGIVIDIPEVIRSMEDPPEEKFLPAYLDKSGEPKGKIVSRELLKKIERHTERIITEMFKSIWSGKLDAVPAISESTYKGIDACKYCDYKSICRRDRIEKQRTIGTIKDLNEALGELQ